MGGFTSLKIDPLETPIFSIPMGITVIFTFTEISGRVFGVGRDFAAEPYSDKQGHQGTIQLIAIIETILLTDLEAIAIPT